MVTVVERLNCSPSPFLVCGVERFDRSLENGFPYGVVLYDACTYQKFAVSLRPQKQKQLTSFSLGPFTYIFGLIQAFTWSVVQSQRTGRKGEREGKEGRKIVVVFFH